MDRPASDLAVGRAARLSLVLLLLINLMNYVDRYILAAVLPLIHAEFFTDPNPDAKYPILGVPLKANTAIGLLTTVFLVSYMIAAPVFGWLADRSRRWLIIGAGVIVWSLASGATGLATTFGILLLTRVFVGIGEAAYGPAAPTLISDMYPVQRRGSVLAWFYMAIPVGSALGYAFGGQVSNIGSGNWRLPFYLVVAPGLALGLWAVLRPEPPRGIADAAVAKRAARLTDYLVLLKTPSFVINNIGMTAMTFAVGGVSVWMPTYVYTKMHPTGPLDPGLVADIGLKFGAISAGCGLFATLAGGWLGDRLRKKMPGSYFIVSGVGMLLGLPLYVAFLFAPFPLAWVLLAGAVFAMFLGTGPSNTILANVTHPSMRATAFAVNILVIHALGDAISPPIIGYIDDVTHDKNLAMASVAVAIVVSGVAWLLGAKFLDRDTQLAPTRLPD